MSDLISKRFIQEALIERISNLNAEGEKSIQTARELIRFKRFVDGLTPSADRPTGEWKKVIPANAYECSECGQYVMTDDIEVYKFCHGCGADMRGEEA